MVDFDSAEVTLAGVILLLGALAAFFLYGRREVHSVKTLTKTPTKSSFRAASASISTSGTPTSSSTTTTTNTTTTNSPGRTRLSLFFGSQTGTAEDFARQVAKQAKAVGFDAKVIDLDELDVAGGALADVSLGVFFLATYGEGEPTDNAKCFYDWLLSADAAAGAPLRQLHFAVFGLGNKTYEHYNSVAKNVDRRLGELGATRVVPLGLGDDDASLEDDFAAWRAGLLAPLAERAGIDLSASAAELLARPSFALREYAPGSSEAKRAAAAAAADTGGVGTALASVGRFDVKTPLAAHIAVNRELHSPDSDRSCRHVEIETRGRLAYEPGDHVGVFAENDAAAVDALAARIGGGGAALDAVVALVDPDSQRVMLGPTTVRNALLRLVEINGALRQSAFALLATYADADADRARLRAWAAPGSASYAAEVRDACRTLPEVLAEMPSLKPPLAVVLEVLPRLAPRYYSISSAPAAHGTRIHVTAIVVREPTPTGRIMTGLCTGFFARTAAVPDQPVACFVRRSAFKLPKSLAAPLLMFGPGTGLAPFRGFIHDLRARGAPAAAAAAPAADRILYYGCRRLDVDALYADELRAAEADRTLTQLLIAESRRAAAAADKVKYVQHLLAAPDNSSHAAALLLERPDTHLYVCGDASVMAKDVHSALVSAVALRLDTAAADKEAAAEKLLVKMAQEGRYLKDVW
jgi:NADPH-ferrihemoprotein reductase